MKLLMITIFTFICSFINVINLNNNVKNEYINDFNIKVSEGYEKYTDLPILETESFTVYTTIGEYNNEIGYSLIFIPNTDYTIKLSYENENQYYEPQTDIRGVSIIYFLIIDNDCIVEIQSKGITTSTITLKYYESLDEVNIKNGKNQGFDPIYFSSINNKEQSKENNNQLTVILSITFTIIIFICIIVILMLSVKKKGLFNKEKFDQEFEREHEVKKQLTIMVNEKLDEMMKEYKNNNDEELQNPKEVYTKTKFYDDEEIRDISLLLQNKGFNTNYKNLDTTEKNSIMLELMMMRNSNEITEEEYKNEIVKLWMK